MVLRVSLKVSLWYKIGEMDLMILLCLLDAGKVQEKVFGRAPLILHSCLMDLYLQEMAQF